MVGHRCEEAICEKIQAASANIPLHSPVNILEADHIYNMMSRVKNGLCMTANPIKFTNKLVPSQEPLVKLRQNHFNEVEVMCPLPIQKQNVLSPSTCEDVRAIVTTYLSRLPQCDLAFSSDYIARRAKEKVYVEGPEADRDVVLIDGNEKFNKDDFEFKIIAADFSPENHFAVNPMQVGKWFPGMYTVYPDSMV